MSVNLTTAGAAGNGAPDSLNASDGTVATVQVGETKLADVANRLGVPLDKLLQANPQLLDANNLQAGQDVRRPDAQIGPVPLGGEHFKDLPGAGAEQIPSVPLGGGRPSGSDSAPVKRGFDRDLGSDVLKARLFGSGLPGASPLTGGDTAAKPLIGSGGSDAVYEALKNADSGRYLADSRPYTPAPANTTLVKSKGPQGPKDHGFGDAGVPKATTGTQKIADKIVDKIYSKVSGALKAEVNFEHKPQLTTEQAALVDFTTGVNQYKQYMDYAKTAIDLLKLYPNNSEIQQRLGQVMEKLDKLGEHLGTVSAVLGKVQKYAGVVKDAIGFAQSAGDLVKNFKTMSFEDFADKFSEVNAKGQSLLGTARDSLISLGLKGSSAAAGAGLVLGGLGAYLDLADDALQAGMKNVKAYNAREQKAIREAVSGIRERPPEPPKLPPPPELQTHGGELVKEKLDNFGRVSNAVHHEFEAERATVKSHFDADKVKAHDQFDHDDFPQIYKQHRREIERDLQREIDFLSHDNRLGQEHQGPPTQADWDVLHQLQATLNAMKQQDRSGPSTADLRSELQGLRFGTPGLRFPMGDITAKLQGLYNDGLSKKYDHEHLNDAGLQDRYAQNGLDRQREHEVAGRLLREFKLVDDKGVLILP